MAGIDNRVLVQLRAEDDGFVAGVRNASRSIEELQRRLGDLAHSKGGNALREAAEYTRGLSAAIRSASPDVQRLMSAISDARKINGTITAYKSLAKAHSELAQAYHQSATAIEKQVQALEKSAQSLSTERASMQSLYAIQANLLRQRAELNKKISELPRTASGAPDRRTSEYKRLAAELQAAEESLKGLTSSKKFASGIASTRQYSSEIAQIRQLKQELNDLNAKMSENRRISQGITRVGRASDTVQQQVELELARIRALQKAEQQRTLATDSRITKARIAAAEARKTQQEEINAALRLNQLKKAQSNFANADIFQRAGAVLQAFSAALSRASTATGALSLAIDILRRNNMSLAGSFDGATARTGRLASTLSSLGSAMSQGSRGAMALGGGMSRLVGGAALVAAGLSKLIGVIRNLSGLLLRLGQAMFNVGALAARTMYNGLKLIVGLAGRFVSSMGNMTRSVLNSVGSFIAASRAKSQYRRELGQTVDAEGWHSRSLKGLIGNVVNLNRWINVLGSSVRQMGQSLQNAGMTLSIFLSYPSTRILSGMTSMVMDFDRQLIEVRKNSDLLLDSLDPSKFTVQTLKRQLVDLLQSTPTQPDVIGKMAADSARLGLPPEYIAPFVQTMDQLVVATNITADDAVDNVGRIMNIFYDLSSEGMKDVEAFMGAVKGLGSAINELGQANPVSERDIVAALLRMSPSAAVIGMDLATAVGLSASVASASASPERAGTQLNTALTQMARNLEDVAKAAGIAFDVLTDQANKNPAETFLSIVDAIAQIPGAMERAMVANEFFGMIGGKAVNVLGASFEKVIENVALARVAFEDGTSLALEFSRAMDAVSNQVGLLKNQFNVIGIALGDAFLPVITQILTYVVPTMQAISKMFQQLDDKIKLSIVGFGLFAAAIGPVMFALGSLMFSFGIMVTGLTSFMTVLGGILKVPIVFASAILSIIAPFGLLKTAILGGIAYLLFFGNTIGSLAEIIVSFGENMYDWGYNIFQSFAEGIYSAATTVVQAVYDTLSAIADMLRSFSPPKEGPLKDIDKWGANIATTFADAFVNADLSGVITFGGKIKSSLERSIRGLDSFSTDLFLDLWSDIKSVIELVDGDLRGGFTSFVNLLSVMQSGNGNIFAAFADLGSYLGGFSQDMIEIIKLQVKYNLEVENGNKIKERLESIDKETQDRVREIAADQSKSISERLAMIRGVKGRAAREKDILSIQLENSEKLQKSLEELLKYQQQVVDIFKEFFGLDKPGGSSAGIKDSSDKLSDEKDKIESSKDELSKISDDMQSVKDKIQSATTSVKESFAGITADAGKFITNVNAARFSIAAFIDALLGKPINKDELAAYGQAYEDAYNKGKAWRDGIISWVDELKRKTKTVKDFLDLIRLVLLVFSTGYTGQSLDEVASPEDAQKAKNVFGGYLTVITNLGAGFKVLLDNTKSYFDYLATLFSGGDKQNPLQAIILSLIQFATAFAQAFSENNPAVSNFAVAMAPIKSIVDSLVVLAGLVFSNLGVLGTFFGEFAKNIVMASGYIGVVLELFKMLAGFGDQENLKNNIELTGNVWLKELFNIEGIEDGDFVAKLIDKIAGWIRNSDFSAVGRELGIKIQEALFGVKDLEGGTFSGGLFNNLFASVNYEAITAVIQNLISTLSNVLIAVDLTPLIDGLGKLLESVLMGLSSSYDFTMIGIALGLIVVKIFSSIPFESFALAATTIMNGIISGLKVASESGDLKQGFVNLMSSMINMLASVNWTELIDSLKNLAVQILDGLGSAPWSTLTTEFTKIITALLTGLSDPNLWGGLGKLLGTIAENIAIGIASADWGSLFSAERLLAMVSAFIDGFWGAADQVQKDRSKAEVISRVGPENISNISALVSEFERLKKLSEENPKEFKYVDQMFDIRNMLIDAGQAADENVQLLIQADEAYARHHRALSEGQNQAFALSLVQGNSLASLIYGITMGLVGTGVEMDEQSKKIDEISGKTDDWFDGIKKWIEELLGMTAKPAKAADDGSEPAAVAVTPSPTEQQTTGSVSVQHTVQSSDAVIAALDAMLAKIQQWADDNKTALNSVGEKVSDHILSGIKQFFTDRGSEYFVALPLRFTSWVTENTQAISLIGDSFASDVLIGLSTHFRDMAEGAFNTILFQLSIWLIANVSTINKYGEDIAEIIRGGISSRLGIDNKYYDEITNALSRFVSSIGSGHSIVKDAKEIGEKIANAIGKGIKDNWKTIHDNIRDAVQRAIDSVSVSTSGGAGGTGSTGGTSGTSGTGGTGGTNRAGVLSESVSAASVLSSLTTEDFSLALQPVSFEYNNNRFDNAGTTGAVVVNINGDLFVDSDKRVQDIADEISRRIAKRARVAYAVR